MRSDRSPVVSVLAAALLILAAGAALAQSRLAKLPPPYTFAQTGDSPGKVTFDHESHVDPASPACTACHPRHFRILVPGGTADQKPITHESMGQGRHCGACHDGEQAFGVDDCSLCHR